MKKRLLALFFSCILLSSCAAQAQELSVSDFPEIVENSTDYNQKDGYFYNILESGGGFLNVNLALCLKNYQESFYVTVAKNTDIEKPSFEQELFNISKNKELFQKPPSSKKLKSESANIENSLNFATDKEFFTGESLSQALYLSKPLPESETKKAQEEKMAVAVAGYIGEKYSLTEIVSENKTLKKAEKYYASLKLDSLKVENLFLTVYSEFAYPYVQAQYSLTAIKNGQTATVTVEENYLLNFIEKDGESTYEVAYAFNFNENFSKQEFCQNNFLILQEPKEPYKISPSGEIIQKKPEKIKEAQSKKTKKVVEGKKDQESEEYFMPIKGEKTADYLEILLKSKLIKEKYRPLVNQNWDLSNENCTQNEDYLNDSVFIGDSIFQGFTYYGLDNTDRVLSKVGVGSRNILLQDLESDGKSYSLQSFLKKKQPKYIYIMLGLNDVNMIDTVEYKNNFVKIIKTVKTTCEDTPIILCSMTPIRKMSFSGPKWISKYNDELKQIAQEQEGVYYLDLFDYLSVNGILANKYSAQDGIHFTAKTYKMITDYIFVHQVKPFDSDTPELLALLEETEIKFDEEKVQQVEDTKKNKGPATPAVETPEEEVPPA